jgi:hypothetical protein
MITRWLPHTSRSSMTATIGRTGSNGRAADGACWGSAGPCLWAGSEQAQWVLQSITSGHASRAKVAEELQVSRAVVDGIIAGRSYRHIPRPSSPPLPSPGTYRGGVEGSERRTLREAQFLASVDTSCGEEDCWPFLGSVNTGGYGQYHAGRTLVGAVSANRVAYVLAHGLVSNLPVAGGLRRRGRGSWPPPRTRRT